MRIVLQRVSDASVNINLQTKAQIKQGLVILVGIEDADIDSDIDWLVNKIINMRIFNDANGVMNLSVTDVKGELLIISQFTLHALTKKGNRPSYIKASKPDIAIPIYNKFIDTIKKVSDLPVYTGIFGADMKVSLTNDGPVTIIIDSKNKE